MDFMELAINIDVFQTLVTKTSHQVMTMLKCQSNEVSSGADACSLNQSEQFKHFSSHYH